MKIARLTLKNIRSYRTADLSLGDGTTLLTGDIGSGKTSLLYAIEMGLFGFAEVDPAHLVRHRAREAEVALTLEEESRRWELRRRFARRMRKGRESFELEENSLTADGERRSYSATELRQRTIDLLGFPDNPNPRAHSDVWRWAVYLAQERMRDVLDPDPDRRLETVRKALGIERYRLAADNAQDVARELGARAAHFADQVQQGARLDAEVERWSQIRSDAQRSLEEFRLAEETASSALRVADEAMVAAEARRSQAELDRQEVTVLGAQRREIAEEGARRVEEGKNLAQRLEDLRREVARAHEGLARRHDLEQQESRLRREREELLVRIAGLETDRGTLQQLETRRARLLASEATAAKRILELESEQLEAKLHVDSLDHELPREPPEELEGPTREELVESRSRADVTRRRLDRLLGEAERELRELDALLAEGICPRCRRPVSPTEYAPHRAEANARVDEMRQQNHRATDELSRLDRAMEAAQVQGQQLERWRQLEQLRIQARELQRQAENALARAGEESRFLGTERTAVEKEASELAPRVAEQAALRSALAAVDRNLEGALAALRELVQLQEEVASGTEEVKQLESRRIALAQEDERDTDRERALTARREELEAKLVLAAGAEAAWGQARSARDSARRALEERLRTTAGVREKLAVATTHLEDLGARLREREEQRQRSERMAELGAWFATTFRPAMVELEQRRLTQARARFERRLARYFGSLVEDPALLARVDETFAPWVEVDGNPTPADALSGGERTALALAFRLALGRVVRDAGRLKLDTLILDEPTEGFSQEQTVRMGELLAELGIPQVLLVSHEPQLAAVADRVVRVRKSGGYSVFEELGASPSRAVAGEPTPPRLRPTEPRIRPARKSTRLRRLTELETADPPPG